ncbi:MAG: lipid-transfer protein, partial [Actinomycetota bacterium]
MRPVAVVAAAISDLTPGDPAVTAIDRVLAVSHRAVTQSELDRRRIGLTVTASSDMLEGRPFNFVKGFEALGTWPAVHARHVEMDGAWAAYEAWLALQAAEFDSALVVAWGTTSEASLHHALNAQLDPFTLAPLGLDAITTAALQADAFLARVHGSSRALDETVVHAREAAARNQALAAMGDWPEDRPVASP